MPTTHETPLSAEELAHCQKHSLDPATFDRSQFAPMKAERHTKAAEIELSSDDRRFCEANGLDPIAFAAARASELAEDGERTRAEAEARKPARAIVAPRAVLTEADRRFCEMNGVDEARFLATRQQELDDEARAKAYRES